jgi:hypothetical protein
MQKLFAILLSGGLLGCTGPAVQVISRTPASIELECTRHGLCPPAQELADEAQRHCQAYGKNAAQRALEESRSGSRWVTYDCVR